MRMIKLSSMRRKVCALTIMLLSAFAFAHTSLEDPVGREMLVAGDNFTIRWSILIAHPPIDHFELYYSTEGPFSGYQEITCDILPSDPYAPEGTAYEYDWIIPSISAPEVWVIANMVAGDPPSDYFGFSFEPFSISLPGPQVCGDPGTVYLDADLASPQDCYVDNADFNILTSLWLNNACTSPGWCNGADLDQSGSINLLDFQLFAQQWLWCTDPGNPLCDIYWR